MTFILSINVNSLSLSLSNGARFRLDPGLEHLDAIYLLGRWFIAGARKKLTRFVLVIDYTNKFIAHATSEVTSPVDRSTTVSY